MGAILLVARSEARRRMPSLLVLMAITSAVVALVLSSVAGARRTESALDRALDNTEASGLFATAIHPDFAGDPQAVADVLQAVGEVEGVEQVRHNRVWFHNLETNFDFSLLAADDGTFYDNDRPLLVEGRMPSPDALDEVAISSSAAAELDVTLGDVITGRTFTPDEIAALVANEASDERATGPELSLHVVGVVRMLHELTEGPGEDPLGIVSPALARAGRDEIGGVVLMLWIRPSPGADPAAAILAAIRDRAEEYEAFIEDIDDIYAEPRSTHRTLTAGIAVFAVVLGAAGVLVIGQAVGRQLQLARSADQIHRGLGMRRRSRHWAVAAPSVCAGVAGIIIGTAGAVALSPLFPLGSARDAESDPGISVDVVVLVVGALAAIVALVAATMLMTSRALRSDKAMGRGRRSWLFGHASKLALRPSAFVGVRMVAQRGGGPTSVPVRPAVVGAVVAVAGVVAVSVFIATADTTLAEPDRYGWTWTATPDVVSTDPFATAGEALEDPRAEAGALLACGPADAGGASLWACALDVFKGSLSFTVTDGRPPSGPAEVALASGTMRDLDLAIGDEVELSGPRGDAVSLTVVGRVVMPPPRDPGRGAVTTIDTLETVQAVNDRQFALAYGSAVDPEGFEADLSAGGELVFGAYSRPSAPALLRDLDEMRSLLVWLGAFLAGLGIVGMLHFLTSGSRRRRTDYAVLQALGFAGRQVYRTVLVQALSVTMVGLALGIPLGMALGRWSWLLAVRELGIVDRPEVPWWVIGTICVGAAGAGTVLAWLPGRLAVGRHPSESLRAE